ncbi:MAG: hypothetical protein AB8B53_04700 [Flavobacteriales bacterium]
MVLKFFRHVTINLLFALIAALGLFVISVQAGIVHSLYFSVVALFIGITLFFTKELTLVVKIVISLLALLVFYYVFNYLLYIELETTVPSVVTDKSYLDRAFFYLKNTTYKDLKSFWPVFIAKLNFMDSILSFAGLGGLSYFGWKYELLGIQSYLVPEDERPEKTGATIQKKRKVGSKRFKRRF